VRGVARSHTGGLERLPQPLADAVPRPRAEPPAAGTGRRDGDGRASASNGTSAEPADDSTADDAPADPAQPPQRVRGPARVIDTATLAVDGRRLRLYGVARGSRRFADQMADYIGNRSVTCSRVRGEAYRCRVDGYDLSEVVLYNGGAHARDGAPRDLQQAEARARRKGLGVWRR
jgi:endonuclease YncB( thermonuclease family)